MVEECKNLRSLRLSTVEFSDLIMLGIGAFSPLEGFMTEKDYRGVLKDMKLSSGTLWPLPVTITVKDKDKYKAGDTAALISPYSDEIVGKMHIEDIYFYDKEAESMASFGTKDKTHPAAARLKDIGDYHIGGKVMVFSEGGYPDDYPQYARPKETRDIFESKGWKTIVAFQTRNPIHRSHEYLTKTVMEVFDGLFIHPIVGKLKKGDIPGPIRIKCYEALLSNYYPPDRVLLKVYPMEMRYAGPKEGVLHAKIRPNYG